MFQGSFSRIVQGGAMFKSESLKHLHMTQSSSEEEKEYELKNCSSEQLLWGGGANATLRSVGASTKNHPNFSRENKV